MRHLILPAFAVTLIALPVEAQSGRPRAVAPGCSADALPAAERRIAEAEYARRYRQHGKANADAFAAREARAFRARLEAQGICPRTSGRTTATRTTGPRAKKVLRNRKGGICTKTRLEQRVTPGFGGAAMSMSMVPVCAN